MELPPLLPLLLPLLPLDIPEPLLPPPLPLDIPEPPLVPLLPLEPLPIALPADVPDPEVPDMPLPPLEAEPVLDEVRLLWAKATPEPSARMALIAKPRLIVSCIVDILSRY